MRGTGVWKGGCEASFRIGSLGPIVHPYSRPQRGRGHMGTSGFNAKIQADGPTVADARNDGSGR
ncbi:MAG: hypothetical protein KatS3mg042_0896 [Rhodothermaceae bacterium]|nr:MAG: hypothetical protein KatS3mg042_0896 [Rhodothermaceae bacterium]